MKPEFDKHAQSAFSSILNVMGEDAVWIQADETQVEGRVLFQYPTQPMKIGQSESYEYKPVNPTAEYYKDTFVGLKEETDAQHNQFLLIRGAKYLVISVVTKWDGDTYIANLELVNE